MDATRSPQRHYIIVVHGIGEQRYNETTVEVVHRFAEARAKDKTNTPYRALLPANLSSLSMRRTGAGHGWSEFRGIPVDPTADTGTFDGTRAARTAGQNFRFVDMRWADILQTHQTDFGSTPEHWASALIDRLQPPFTPPNWSACWVMPLLYEIERTLVPMKALLTYYFPEAAKTIFRDVIGDLHLYGDYARTRGQAIRRFHTVMDEIHLRDYIQWCRFERERADEPYVPPIYTVIAHSLGSVLSFDALIYAFAKDSIRDGNERHPSGSLPFPGYNEREDYDNESWVGLVSDLMKHPRRTDLPNAEESWALFGTRYPQFSELHGATMPKPDASPKYPEPPLLLWRNHVKHFITLGSPIDKFLTLWHHNYRHMGLSHHSFPTDWSQGWLDDTNQHRIAHYNLCDEQDPVGHHLDTAQKCPNYSKVFDTTIPVTYRDVVFRRYSVPGVAHIQYWKDQTLFDGLLAEVIDEPNIKTLTPSTASPQPQTPTSRWGRFVAKDFIEVDRVYATALIWAYFRIPLIASVVTGLLLSYGWIGWWYEGFSLSYSLALLAGVLLWVCPNPTHAYRQEAKPGDQAETVQTVPTFNPSTCRQDATPSDRAEGTTVQASPTHAVVTSWWARWKPRRGLCANLVAGSVAWRRILIWLNQHPNQTFELSEALDRNIRLSLSTAGGFRRHSIPRIAFAIVVFLLAAALTCVGRVHLLPAPKGTASPPFWYVATLVLMTVSGIYLLVMAYVGIFFRHMKYHGQPDLSEKTPR
jgi:hypothetical protein